MRFIFTGVDHNRAEERLPVRQPRGQRSNDAAAEVVDEPRIARRRPKGKISFLYHPMQPERRAPP